MKKVTITLQDGTSFSGHMEDPTAWIASQEAKNRWSSDDSHTVLVEDVTADFNLDALRQVRNRFLEDTDRPFIIEDFPMDAALKTKWQNYRVYLRDITTEDPLPAVPKTFEEWDV